MIMLDIDEERLDKYIDEILVPNNAIGVRKREEDTLDEYYETIIYKNILETRFSELELEYVFEALNKRNIKVTGKMGRYYANFENYETDYSCYQLPTRTITEEEQNSLLEEYQKTRDIELRNKIVEQNLHLAYHIAEKYKLYYGLDAQDLMSYAVEGLLLSIEKYKSGENKFSSYAGKYIEGYIKGGIVELKNYKSDYLFWNMQSVRNSLKENDWYDDDNYINYLDQILAKLVEEKSISAKYLKDYRTKINIFNPKSLEECLSEADRLVEIDDRINREQKIDEIKLIIKELWDDISEEEQDILQNRLMNNNKTLAKIGEKWNSPRQTIKLHEEKLKSKIKEKLVDKV